MGADRPAIERVAWIGPEKDRHAELIARLKAWFVAVEDWRRVLAEGSAEAIIFDLTLGREEDLQRLLELKRAAIEALVIGLVRRGGRILSRVVEAGLSDVIFSPVDLEELSARLDLAGQLLHRRRSFQRVGGGVAGIKATYRLPTDFSLIAALTHIFTRDLKPRGQATDEDIFQLRLTLSEVLTNAMEHGSLEISLEDKMAALEAGTYEELLSRRLAHPDFKRRLVTASYEIREDEVRFVIRDDGPGFDTSKVMERLADPNPNLPCGRGLFLIGHFMDQFFFEDSGRQITLVKKLPAKGK